MHSDWFFLGRDFAIRAIAMETVISSVFCRQIQTLQPKRVNDLIFAKKLPKRLIFYSLVYIQYDLRSLNLFSNSW